MDSSLLIPKVIRGAAELGVGDTVAEPAAVLARIAALDAQLADARTAADAAWSSAVAALAADGITANVEQLLAKYAAMNTRSEQNAPPIVRAVAHARVAMVREAEAVGVASGGKLLAALVDVANTAVARIASLRIPMSVVDDRTAFQARVSPAAWDELGVQYLRFEQAHDVYAAARKLEWLPQFNRFDAPTAVWARYANPYKVPDKGGVGVPGRSSPRLLPPHLLWARSVGSVAAPGMYTPAQAQVSFKAWQAEVNANDRMTDAQQAARAQQTAEARQPGLLSRAASRLGVGGAA